MAGTYSIIENKTDAIKFRCMVSFNGNPGEYYEVDSLEAGEIDKVLQMTADAHAEKIAKDSEIPEIGIIDGKILV